MNTRSNRNDVESRQNTRIPAKRVLKETSSRRGALGEISNVQVTGNPSRGHLPNKKIKQENSQTLKKETRRTSKTTITKVNVAQDDKEVVDVIPVLPDGVPDIDAPEGQNKDPQLCVEYVREIYVYMREKEKDMRIRKSFLKGCYVSGDMRGVLMDWLIEAHSQFKCLQETLYVAIHLIDRFLQSREGLSLRRAKLQLVGVAGMWIASKVEEIYAPEISDFVYIADGAYTASEIREMEIKMLSTLEWNIVSRPLPLHFLRRLSKAGDVDVLQHTVAKYLMEMTLPEYDMAHLPPSLVAAAALFLSLRLMEPQASLANTWTPTLQFYSKYSAEELIPVVCQLAGLVSRRDETKFQAVHLKYLRNKFLKVAEQPELKAEVVSRLAKKQLSHL